MAKKIKSVSKKISRRLLKLWSGIISAFLGLFAIQSCPMYGPPPMYGIIPMYGPPPEYTHLTVTGTVASSQAPLPTVPGIEVSAYNDTFTVSRASTNTDANGLYTLNFDIYGPVSAQTVGMRFVDTDGPVTNGNFKSKDDSVSFSAADFTDANPTDYELGRAQKTLNETIDPQ
jgi:putative lipoprotein (rSAM/lipoprotein system)